MLTMEMVLHKDVDFAPKFGKNLDSYEVCTFLQISDRTLQRLRANGTIAYSNIGGRCYYKIGELKRLLEERLIKSNDECMRNLVANHEAYAKERRNSKQNK